MPLRIALQKTSWGGSGSHRRTDSSDSSNASCELSPSRDMGEYRDYHRPHADQRSEGMAELVSIVRLAENLKKHTWVFLDKHSFHPTFIQMFLWYTVKPRLSGMHLSRNTAIRTVFLGNEKTQRNFAPFSRKSVFPEPDSSLGNQTMFYNDQRSMLSGHAPECH